MKNGLLLFLSIFISMLLVTRVAEASVSISNVVCQQQYPWNGKVNIEFEVCGGPEDTNIWISASGCDKTTGKTFLINALSEDGGESSIKPGKHHLVWDVYKDYPNLKTDAFSITLKGISSPKYMIVDLETGVITYRESEPNGGWPDEYKTTKMVLRLIQPGTFVMGSPENELGRISGETQHSVTITKPFYIGVFETTQKQYEIITGSDPSCYKGDMRPVESISYNMIRGDYKGSCWPNNGDVDDYSFLGIFRAKTKLPFDLPTEAQWEYACRAGTTTAWNNGTDITDKYHDPELDKLGRYSNNQEDGKGGYFSDHTTVGSYFPNAWGLYDMHGNVWEWCLDWGGEYEGDSIDPKGYSNGYFRILRSGSSSLCPAFGCRSAYRLTGYGKPDYFNYDFGFRIVLIIQRWILLK